jgi:hypothetical protein
MEGLGDVFFRLDELLSFHSGAEICFKLSSLQRVSKVNYLYNKCIIEKLIRVWKLIKKMRGKL